MASSESLQLQGQGFQRQDLRAAIAKSVELRALHAALLQGGSPSLSRSSHQFSTEDYPVFTPSYDEEPMPGYHYMLQENRSQSESWSGIVLDEESKDIISDTKSLNGFTNNLFSKRSMCPNHLSIDMPKSTSRRTNSSEFKPFNTCNNTFKPESIIMENDVDYKNSKSFTAAKPIDLPSKHKGAIFSWLFHKSKKKPKPEMSPNPIESEDMSQVLKDWRVLSIETMKKELLEANETKDAALAEVSDMKSSLGELQHKLASLELYCEELKKALKKTMQAKDPSKRTRIKESSMPVSEEVMVEGFLQIVSEARLSVKQFCKILVSQIEETDIDPIDQLNVNLSNKYSKGVLYHLESLINNSLYQDFENCVFQKNGAPNVLDPQKNQLTNFSSFVALRSLSWNEILHKGTKFYSEDFSRFCDEKMDVIVSVLNWSTQWPEQLLQSFFVSAKCIWLLHLLAFSFNQPPVILRVEEDRKFDPLYMEDVLFEKQRLHTAARVKVMVMPGFYVRDRVLRCRVLCRYRCG